MRVNSLCGQRGLSLVEVLVSLIVGGLFLGILLPNSTTALRRLSFDSHRGTAVEIARNQIESLSAWPATAPVPDQGISNGLRWRVQALTVEGQSGTGQGGIVLRNFRVTVSDPIQAEPLVDVTIARLGRAQ